MPIRRTFRSSALQRRFEALGFVVTDGFDEEQVGRLRAEMAELYRGEKRGFHSSVESRDHAYRARLHAAIEPWFRSFIGAVLDDHVVLNTAVLVKWPGDDSTMGPHQDWTFVDETRFRTLNLWCPLDDLTTENGALAVLPGSQQLLDHIRPSPHLPDAYDDPTRRLGVADLDPLRVRAGQVVAVDHGLLHASPPNRSDQPRFAVAAAVAPAEADLVHHYCHGDGALERFSVPDARWFHTFDFGDAPVGLDSLGTVAFTGSTATAPELRARGRHPTFLDEDAEQAFVDEGYLVMDLLDPDGVRRLQAAYDELDHHHVDDPGFAAGFHTTLYDDRVEYRRRVLDAIDSTIGAALDDHLVDHAVVLANFMVKQPGGAPVPPHIDWTFVDESRFTSLTVWCALGDIGPDGGPLGVHAGSHHNVDFVRAVNHREPDRHAATGERDPLVLTLRAGQAVVTDNRTLHFSLPNTTEQPRVVAACVVGPRSAALHHFWIDPEGRVLRLDVDRDFYCTYTLGQDPRRTTDSREVRVMDEVLIG